MKIGVLGAGNMARAVGIAAARIGHQVLFGARRTEQGRFAAVLAGHGATSGSIDEAAAFGQMIVWTVREIDPETLLSDVSALDGKIVLDVNNRDYAAEVAAGILPGASLGETLQSRLPRAHVVKCFTTIPMEAFNCEPDELRAVDAQTFIAGNDVQGKAAASSLIAEIGFRSIDMGDGLVAFRAVEALGDCVRHIMATGNSLQAHLRLDLLPTSHRTTVGSRVCGKYR